MRQGDAVGRRPGPERSNSDMPAMLRPASIADGAYEIIYNRLMSLEIAPGSRLSIDTLARNLDISQTPVREALARLEREGLVQKAHLIGYSAAPQLTQKQFDDLFHFRLLLEPDAARLAAQKMTPEALAFIETAAADVEGGGTPVNRDSRYSRFARADGLFHDAIFQVADNEIVRHALSSQHIHLHIFRLMFHTRVTAEALNEHENLLAAFRAGDAIAAELAMRTHIEKSRDRLMQAF